MFSINGAVGENELKLAKDLNVKTKTIKFLINWTSTRKQKGRVGGNTCKSYLIRDLYPEYRKDSISVKRKKDNPIKNGQRI